MPVFCVHAACPAQTNGVFVLLICGFIESPLEINGDTAHTTSKLQSRLRCRWTLCPFITHALNHLAVISLATGEGIRGHLTSCSLGPLRQMAKGIYFSQSILLAAPPSLNALYGCAFPVSDHSSSILSAVCVCVFLPSCTSSHTWSCILHTPTPTHTEPHVHKSSQLRMGSGCHDNRAHQNPIKWNFLPLHQTDK